MPGIRNWLGEVCEDEETKGRVGNGRQKMSRRRGREKREKKFWCGVKRGVNLGRVGKCG